MSILEGDIIQITMNGELFTERVSNVFYYVAGVVLGTPTLDDLLAVFQTDVVDVWIDIVSEDYSLVDIRADNLTNELDFFVLGLTGGGALLTPSVSSAVAGAIALRVSTKLTRPGSKRIAGITESQVQDNTWTPDGTLQTLLEVALGSFISTFDVDPSNAVACSPVVVGRFPITDPDAGKIDISRFQLISGVDIKSNVTTQTSRRPGRGI